jgi:ATP diphosphatase
MSDAQPSGSQQHYSMADLLRIMQRLRDPELGCPWDLKQDFASIVPYTLEECYELADAIGQNDLPHISDELGDVLFQVVFYSQLGSEQGAFDFSSVVDGIARKLLRRHPHVFAGGEVEGRVTQSVTTAQVKERWEAIKQEERAERAGTEGGILDDVPNALPALSRAQKLQKRAAGVGFDWPDSEGVMTKLEEELAELKSALDAGSSDAMAEELGDVLFTVVNMTRRYGLDAEAVLRQANQKFEARFQHMERAALEAGSGLAQESLEQLEQRWEAAKSDD